jgi:hypothetical protein
LQIVWPSTTAVGMGSAVDSSGNTYVVARYSPEGNVTGQPVWGLGGTATPGAPASTQDGVYLVNSTKGSQWTSGFAWYASMGNNDGQQPGAYINIDTASTVTWEGSSFSGTLHEFFN